MTSPRKQRHDVTPMSHRFKQYVIDDSSGMGGRLFTPQQANRTLPLVRRIIADLRQEHTLAKGLHDALCNVPLMDRDQRRQIGRRLTRSVRKMERLVEEIHCIGADVADYRTATVEFAAMLGDKPILLSWRPGEEVVAHWREPSAAADERHRLTELAVG